MEIRDTANYDLDGIDYDIRICDTPAEMESIVVEKNRARNRARILAGYCWNWPKATRNNTNYHDIEIGDYSISWNLDGGDAFAISEESIHEAGCIHTTQGLEFDYVGVIIGDDMRYENGEWHFYKFNGHSKWNEQIAADSENKKELQKYMLNAYRVLLTRARSGMVICVPYGNGNKTSTGFWEDSTRLPEYYNGTYEYLKSLGIEEI